MFRFQGIHFVFYAIIVLGGLGGGCFCVRPLNATEMPPSYHEDSSEEGVIRWFLETLEQNGGRELIDRIESGEPIEAGEFQELDRIFGLDCLIGGFRPNFDMIDSPANREYKPVRVCIEQDAVNFPECTAENTIQFVDRLDASGAEFRYLNSSGPAGPALQGVFWLNYNGDAGGALVSYAPSRDGGSLNRGFMQRSDDDISFRARTGGDRVFSFTGNNIEFKYIQLIDVIYETRVTEGTDTDPKRCQIFYSVRVAFAPCWRYHFRECFNWVYYYDMILLQDDELKGEYKDSVVWRRDSKIFNWSGSYPITQIIDGQGQPVEPAYSQWVERSQTIMRIGDEPNKNVFFSLDDYDGVSSKVRDCDALRSASRNQTDGGSS